MGRNQRIKNALKTKGISQERLAEHLGTTQAAVGKQLNKREDIDSLQFLMAVCELTGIALEYFLKEDIQENFSTENDLLKEEIRLLKQENQTLRSALREIGAGGGGGGDESNRNVG